MGQFTFGHPYRTHSKPLPNIKYNYIGIYNSKGAGVCVIFINVCTTYVYIHDTYVINWWQSAGRYFRSMPQKQIKQNQYQKKGSFLSAQKLIGVTV